MWAASSWGRYWGWDPKEVWSLVAFLAYMAILHAKLDRLIGKFGVAAISIAAVAIRTAPTMRSILTQRRGPRVA